MRVSSVLITPAPDTTLLTIAELRAAIGEAGASKDIILLDLERKSTANIMAECNIATVDGGNATLRQETVEQTFYQVNQADIELCRRHNLAIVSVTSDGAVLSANEYFTNSEAGIITRLSNDTPIRWVANKLVIRYTAGFAVVPNDLKDAMAELVNHKYAATTSTDVRLEETEIYGVQRERVEYFSASQKTTQALIGNSVPDDVANSLVRFKRHTIV